MARFSRKDLKHDEFVETAVDIGQWLEDHWRSVATWGGAVVVVAAVVALVIWNNARTREQTRQILADGMSRYQQAETTAVGVDEELREALALFEEAAERGGAAGEVARYYQAATLGRLGRVDEALPLLEQLVEAGLQQPTLAGSAQSLLASLYVETGQADRAIELLTRLADEIEPSFPADQALAQLARLHEDRGDVEEARRIWQRIIDEYPGTAGATEAGAALVQ
jgi:tetratricopeptide (TPR) repeat protein